MIKILGYGSGDCFKLYHKSLDYDKVQLLGVLDKNPPADGRFAFPIAAPYDVPIVPASTVDSYEFDYVVIFSYNNATEMKEFLISQGIPDEKIVYAEMNDPVSRNFKKFDSLCMDEINGYSVVENPSLANERKLKDYTRVSRTDYVRIATLETIAGYIREKKITGSVAEAGVFRGFFSSLINELLPDKKLYLFDTFEGFDDRDMEDETEGSGEVTDKNGFAYREFKDTSVEVVLSVMKYPENCIVKKGYFPDTASDIPDTINFSLVSLDMDLYFPIYEGLRWFYPRMSKGGYILVHDYNNKSCPGVKQAVDQFCEESGTGFVPIADYCGTVVFVKQ